jgi:hypothetical protein
MNEIKKDLIEEYLKLLSPDSFCTLLRFYLFYLNNKEKSLDISIPSFVFQKHILISDDKNRIEFVWGELSYWSLVKRIYDKNIYELNIGKLLNNNECFRITLNDQGLKIRKNRRLNENLIKYIERIISGFSNPRLSEKVNEVINGHIKFLLSEQGKVELQDIKYLTDPFFETSDLVLEKTCDIYITSYYAKKPAQYIHGILKKVQNEKTEVENKNNNSPKTLMLKQYKQELDESNKTLALKIATGQVKENKSYLAYLKSKDIKNLNKLYKIGIKMLIENNKASEIFKDYDWIQND